MHRKKTSRGAPPRRYRFVHDAAGSRKWHWRAPLPYTLEKTPPTLQITFDNKKRYDARAIQSYVEDVEDDSDGIDGDGCRGEVGSDDSAAPIYRTIWGNGKRCAVNRG